MRRMEHAATYEGTGQKQLLYCVDISLIVRDFASVELCNVACGEVDGGRSQNRHGIGPQSGLHGSTSRLFNLEMVGCRPLLSKDVES
jgi:hypothetical protein